MSRELIAALVVLIVGIGSYGVWQRFQVAELSVQIEQLKRAKIELQSSLERQGEEVERVGRDCKQKQDDAIAAALRALSAPPPPVSGAGPDALNRWLQSLLGAP